MITLIDLGHIAAQHDTEISHAMLQAIAVVFIFGSEYGFDKFCEGNVCGKQD